MSFTDKMGAFAIACVVALAAIAGIAALVVTVLPIITTTPGAAARPEIHPVEPAVDVTPTATPVQTLAWGAVHSYGDGVSIVVSAPEVMPDAGKGTPWADYLALDPSTDFDAVMPVKAAITLTNNSDKIIDPTASLDLIVDGDEIRPTCVDAECGIFLGGMWPGNTLSADWMWWVPREAADQITIEASAGPDYAEVAYAGAVTSK